ncbi:MAG TPA: efflux RND transporter periplasmic adaptor subunit [Phycisphaerales bacterium]|nr:efflux RND transporter periplasmic adaptor subunit [Phycisphaerales bacterium]
MWKWLLIALILVAGMFGAAFYFAHESGVLRKIEEQFNPKAKAMEVKFGTVDRGVLIRTISAPGQVEPKTLVEISAQVSARIIEMPFDENDLVKRGDVVVRLDDRDLKANVDAANASLRQEEARLAGARAGLANSEIELKRVQDLVASKDAPAADLDTARLEYSRAESTLRQVEHAIEIARANIQRAEKDLSNAVITAPFDGVITARNAEVGETVVVGTLNNPGSVIMEIADLSTMLVKARVDEANIAPIRDGQGALIYINAYPNQRFTGKVEHVGLKRMLDRENTPYFEAEVLIDRPGDMVLRSGLTANVDIQVETFAQVLKAPTQSVLDRAVDELPADVTKDNPIIEAGKKYTRVVYIDDGGKARPVPVRVGASDDTHTIITDGLSEGAKIVVGPFKALSKMQNGQSITAETIKKKDDATTTATTASTK